MNYCKNFEIQGRSVFNDFKTILSATSKQIEDVFMASNQLHGLHLSHKVTHFKVSCIV